MGNSTLELRHTLVICSRNRVESLLNTLGHILDQEGELVPQKIILVVNLTNNEALDSLILKVKCFNHLNIRVIKTSKGLPSARNIAIKSIDETDVVHFIDDDVLVDRKYFKGVEDFLRDYPQADGGSPIERFPLRVEPYSGVQLTRFLKLWLGLVPSAGNVTSSLRNFWGFAKLEEPIAVEWLPGLAMFYRFKVIRTARFPEELEKNELGGYGLGEDLIFTLKLTSKGCKLYGVPNLGVNHLSDPQSPRQSRQIHFASGELRGELFLRFPKKFSKVRYFLSLLFELTANTLKSPSNLKTNLLATFSEISGFWSKTK